MGAFIEVFWEFFFELAPKFPHFNETIRKKLNDHFWRATHTAPCIPNLGSKRSALQSYSTPKMAKVAKKWKNPKFTKNPVPPKLADILLNRNHNPPSTSGYLSGASKKSAPKCLTTPLEPLKKGQNGPKWPLFGTLVCVRPCTCEK